MRLNANKYSDMFEILSGLVWCVSLGNRNWQMLLWILRSDFPELISNEDRDHGPDHIDIYLEENQSLV
jgi:hypothetical protein